MFAWKDENKQKEDEDGSFKKTNFITQVVKIFWDFWAILKEVNLNALAMFRQLSDEIGHHLIPTSRWLALVCVLLWKDAILTNMYLSNEPISF